MHGQRSHEVEIRAGANELWEIYGTLQLAHLVTQYLPHVVQKVHLLEGDGGVGTVFHLTFPTGMTYKERFVKVDNEKRMKEAEVIEGGFLDMGFRLYRLRFEIIEKSSQTSIVRSTIEYEIEDEYAANESLVSTEAMAVIAEFVEKYISEKNTVLGMND